MAMEESEELKLDLEGGNTRINNSLLISSSTPRRPSHPSLQLQQFLCPFLVYLVISLNQAANRDLEAIVRTIFYLCKISYMIFSETTIVWTVYTIRVLIDAIHREEDARHSAGAQVT